jgi:hypothetical protein
MPDHRHRVHVRCEACDEMHATFDLDATPDLTAAVAAAEMAHAVARHGWTPDAARRAMATQQRGDLDSAARAMARRHDAEDHGDDWQVREDRHS